MMHRAILTVAVLGLAAGAAWADDDEGPSPLRTALYELDQMRDGRNTSYDKVEAGAQRLLKEYTKPEEHGKIYFTLASVYAQSAGNQAEPRAKAIQWCKKALEFPLDIKSQQRMCTYLGDSISVSLPIANSRGEGWPALRREAVVPYLRGLKALLPYDLPNEPITPPEPPAKIGRMIADPADAEHQKRVEEYERQIEALRKIRFTNDLIECREIQTRQIAGLYFKTPASDELVALDELETIARDVLQDDKAVANLIATVKAIEHEREQKRAARAATTRPAP